MDRTYWESLAKAAVSGVVTAGVTCFATLTTTQDVIVLIAATGGAFFAALATATVQDRRSLAAEQRAMVRARINA